MFKKEDRSTFAYWFAHWCAFQMTALNMGCWHPRFLLHDIEKPWLRLFMSYDKVQKYHRTHSAHHLEYHKNKYDWLSMFIDWECSRFTKEATPYNANTKCMKVYWSLIRKRKYSLANIMRINIKSLNKKYHNKLYNDNQADTRTDKKVG